MKVEAFYIVFLLCISIILTGCQNTGGLEDDTSDLSAQEATEIFSDNPETVNESDAVTETAKAQFAYGEWYLSEWERYPEYQMKEQEENLKGIYIKCPLVYEENAEIVKVKVEFFVEEYHTYSYIQTRLTYTNLTNERIVFDASHPGSAGIFEDEGNPDFALSPYASKNHDDHHTDSVFQVVLEPEESYSDEIVFYMGPWFYPEKSYTYSAKIYQYSLTEETKIYGITIPIEVYRAE